MPLCEKDDIWLSPAYGRDSAYIAVHMYKGMKYAAYFGEVEKIFQSMKDARIGENAYVNVRKITKYISRIAFVSKGEEIIR